MDKYTKKPLVIQAEQFLKDAYDKTGKLPEGACNCSLGDSHIHCHALSPDGIEGIVYVSDKDWVVLRANGCFYPVDAETFTATYEKVT